MYIGLFDQDLLVTPKTFVPSLELMKYSYYYKMNNNIVKMVYDANAISPFDKVIVSSNLKGKRNLPRLLMANPKVEWTGTAFFKTYSRLPKEIETCNADKSIYEPFYRKNKNNLSCEQIAKLNPFFNIGAAYRLTHKGEIIFDYEKVIEDRSKIYLYDEDIFSCPEILEQIPKFKTNHGICFIKTQIVSDFDTFLKTKKEFPGLTFYSSNSPILVYNGELTKKDFLNHYLDLSRLYCLMIPSNRQSNESWNEFGLRQFLILGNYYFYSMARGHKITFVPNPNLPLDSDGTKLLNCLCRFTRICGFSTNTNFYQFVNKVWPNMKICDKYKYDSSLNRIFSANLKQVCQCGVWIL